MTQHTSFIPRGFSIILQVSYKYPTVKMSNPTQQACLVLLERRKKNPRIFSPSIAGSLYPICCQVSQTHIQHDCTYIGCFPKIGGFPPKWMVYKSWKSLWTNGWFGGWKTHYFRRFVGGEVGPQWMSPIPNGWSIKHLFEKKNRWHSFLPTSMDDYIIYHPFIQIIIMFIDSDCCPAHLSDFFSVLLLLQSTDPWISTPPIFVQSTWKNKGKTCSRTCLEADFLAKSEPSKTKAKVSTGFYQEMGNFRFEKTQTNLGLTAIEAVNSLKIQDL